MCRFCAGVKIKNFFTGVFIVGAKRTAFGTFGGAFKNTSATQLQTAAAKAAIQSAGVKPEQIDSVNIGQVIVVSIESIFSKWLWSGFYYFFLEFIFRWSFPTPACAVALWNSN